MDEMDRIWHAVAAAETDRPVSIGMTAQTYDRFCNLVADRYHFSTPHMEPYATMFGLRIIIRAMLPPNSIELRSDNGMIRIINLAS